MEELTRAHPAHPAHDGDAGQQVPLPFDDEADQPIAYSLTTRARRTVAPDALPVLRVVAGVPTARQVEVDDDPTDTRPARARALRRAGVGADDIADQLGVDELLVRAWTTGVVGPARARRGPATAAHRVVVTPAADGDHGPSGTAADGDVEVARAQRRERARVEARRRLLATPALGAGLGVIAGTADLGRDAVTVTTTDPRVAGTVVRWLVDVVGADRADVRLVLRVGADVAGDVARHTWGRSVGIDPARIRTTRAGAPVDHDRVEAVLRIVDADLAATVAGWCDALLADPDADDTF